MTVNNPDVSLGASVEEKFSNCRTHHGRLKPKIGLRNAVTAWRERDWIDATKDPLLCECALKAVDCKCPINVQIITKRPCMHTCLPGWTPEWGCLPGCTSCYLWLGKSCSNKAHPIYQYLSCRKYSLLGPIHTDFPSGAAHRHDCNSFRVRDSRGCISWQRVSV